MCVLLTITKKRKQCITEETVVGRENDKLLRTLALSRKVASETLISSIATIIMGRNEGEENSEGALKSALTG